MIKTNIDSACVEICPVNALEKQEIDQQVCWDYAFGDNPETKNWEISCHKCRDICPYNRVHHPDRN